MLSMNPLTNRYQEPASNMTDIQSWNVLFVGRYNPPLSTDPNSPARGAHRGLPFTVTQSGVASVGCRTCHHTKFVMWRSMQHSSP